MVVAHIPRCTTNLLLSPVHRHKVRSVAPSWKEWEQTEDRRGWGADVFKIQTKVRKRDLPWFFFRIPLSMSIDISR